MADTSEEIEAQIERLRDIAETLEDGDIGLAEAKRLRDEADDLLETLREVLETDDGRIIEVDPDEQED
jgi:Exonuclease VII small subunit.